MYVHLGMLYNIKNGPSYDRLPLFSVVSRHLDEKLVEGCSATGLEEVNFQFTLLNS